MYCLQAVGFPSVGKSSTINALIQFKKVPMSACHSEGGRNIFRWAEWNYELIMCTVYFLCYILLHSIVYNNYHLLLPTPHIINLTPYNEWEVSPMCVLLSHTFVTSKVTLTQMRDHIPPVSLVASRIPRLVLEDTYLSCFFFHVFLDFNSWICKRILCSRVMPINVIAEECVTKLVYGVFLVVSFAQEHYSYT